MREKASNTIKSKTASQVKMGPIKSLGELQDSILKMREHFDLVFFGKVPQAYPLPKDG
jgi:hypothetical protein